MLKIKTKIIMENGDIERVGVKYESNHTNTYEHLVLINHLIKEILENDKTLTEDEVLGFIIHNVKENDVEEFDNE